MGGVMENLSNLLYNNVLNPVTGALQGIASGGFTIATLASRNSSQNGTDHSVTVQLSDSDLHLFLRIKWFFSLLPLVFYCCVVPLLLNYIYGLLYRPLNRIRWLGSTGYLSDDAGVLSRKEIANMVRRRRKIGEDLPPVYPNGWFRLLDTQQLAKGQVKEVTALGEHFAVYRTTKGKAHVLDAYCPHMGGNLAVGGRVKGDCLECPFHGWTFSGDGKCTDVPYSTKVPNFSKVKSWPCREMNGSVYVWYHCDGLEPQWEMPSIDEINSGKFKYIGRMEHHTNSHIQELPENGSDYAHLAYLHLPNIVSGVDITNHYKSWWNFITHDIKAEYKGIKKDAPHISGFDINHNMVVFNGWKFYNLKFNIFQIGPGVVHLHLKTFLGDAKVLQHVTPVEPLHQNMAHICYTNMPMWAAKLFLYLDSIQIDRDVAIWNNKTFVPKPLLVKEDDLIAKYRRWFSQFYSENSPRLQMKTEDATW